MFGVNVGSSGVVCKFFQTDTCTKGNICRFKHIKSEKTTVCKHWLRGLCKKVSFKFVFL